MVATYSTPSTMADAEVDGCERIRECCVAKAQAMTQEMGPTLLVLASTYPRWSHDHEPGFVHELAKRLTTRFRVLALVPHAPGALPRETLDGVEVIRYRYAPEWLETLVNDGGIVTNLRRHKWKHLLVPGFVLAQAWCAWRLLRREQVDVVHAHWLIPQGLIAALLQFLSGQNVPFVVTSHGADLYALKGRLVSGLNRFVAGKAAALTVVSDAMRERLRELGADVARTTVLPMGVDMLDRFSRDPSVSRSKHEILFVGRLVEKKGLHHLLDAMPAVRRQFSDASLRIAGFGPERAALQEQVRRLGLQASVRFLGAVPQVDLPVLYRRSALFVAPFVRAQSGDEEGLGLVLVEAIGCGCPVVVGNVPAMDDLLGRDFYNLRVDPGNTAQLASAIIDALSDPAQALERAERLRDDIGARFDWSAISNLYAELLLTAMP